MSGIADTLLPRTDEAQGAISATVATSDTITVAFTEFSFPIALLLAADALAPRLDEAAGISARAATSDSLTPILGEGRAVTAQLHAGEALLILLADIARLFSATVPARHITIEHDDRTVIVPPPPRLKA